MCLAQSAAFAQSAPKPATGATASKAGAAKPPAAGAAKPNVAEAKTHYLAGEVKFKSADYAGALADFQAADTIKGTPQAARFIGLCQDKLGHYPEALAAYDRFLGDVPPKLAKEGDEVKAREAEIKALPGKVHTESTPPGAVVQLDGKSVGGASGTPTDFDAAPGHHTLHFSAEGRLPVDKDIDVSFASKQDVNVTLDAAPAPVAVVAVAPVPTPPPAAPPPPPPEPRSKLPAYVTGGLAIVAAGVGTAFGVVALGDKSDFDKNPTTAKADDGENHALIADMAFGVAIT
ncbi:MAG: PEGA domain-containing protein, partial [Polyangiaceae bacterium]